MVRAPTYFAFRAKSTEESIGRIVDSGASAHFTGDSSLFTYTITPSRAHIGGIAGGLTAAGHGSGQVVIGGVLFHLTNLIYVPDLATTLISMSGLVEDGCHIVASKVSGVHVMTLRAPSGSVASISPVNGLYPCSPTSPPQSAFVSVEGVPVGRTHVGHIPLDDLLHRRLGHHSWGNKHLAGRLRAEFGSSLGKGHSIASCDACCKTKLSQVFSRLPPRRPATRPLERVHFDFVPHLPVLGVGGYVGFIVVLDEFTENYFFYPIRSKAELPAILESFRVSSERHFRLKLGTVMWPLELASIRSDGEPVCISDRMQAWCSKHHIIHERCAPYSQWQNGMAERAIQSILQGSEAMREAAGAPPSAWVYSVPAFVHTRNLWPWAHTRYRPGSGGIWRQAL